MMKADPECASRFVRMNGGDLSPIPLTADYIRLSNDLELLCTHDFFMNHTIVNGMFCHKNEKSQTIEEENDNKTDDKFMLHPEHTFADKKYVLSRRMNDIPKLIGQKIPICFLCSSAV